MQYQFPIIYPVACHTDNIGSGSTFVALPGTKAHGVQFIKEAVEKGATRVVVPHDAHLESDLIAFLDARHVHLEYANNIRERFAELAAQANDYPADQLHIIGITGTKGKTTTSFLVRHILHEVGFNTALLGTVHNQIGEHIVPQSLTTPHADYLQVFLRECVEQGITHVMLEVSAQALSLARVHGIPFGGVIFTNFSQEHGEFYATQNDYFAAKCKIFEQLSVSPTVVLNTDDAASVRIVDPTLHPTLCTYCASEGKKSGFARECPLYLAKKIFVGMSDDANYTIKINESSMEQGLTLEIGKQLVRCPKLVGTFNAYNIAMAFALCKDLGIEIELIMQALETFPGVKGRMQTYALPNGAQCIIDHAHTPSSFEAVLSTLRTHTNDLIAVFGIGGNRDTVKRPILGAIAAQYADTVILTTDNPRNEKPEDIIADIKHGIAPELMHKVHTVLDREEAIKYAYSISQEGSIIALLAKGSDEYQEIKGVKYPFVERDIVVNL